MEEEADAVMVHGMKERSWKTWLGEELEVPQLQDEL